jgi:hypothetical protein
MAGIRHPVTPDERYFVVKGKLWRLSDPGIEAGESARLVRTLMEARHAVKDAKSAGDRNAELEAHRRVDEAKRALGERGPVWWDDGAPDFNRHAVKNTPYAGWYSKQRSD